MMCEAMVATESPTRSWDGHTSLWRQAKAVIRDMVVTEFRPGDLIPSEAELCKRLGVSRITIRQAITSLVYEGYLVRMQGRGTIVLPPKHEAQLAPSLQSLDSGPREVGFNVECRLISKETLPSDKRLAALLRIPPGTFVHKVRVLYLSSGEPVGQYVSYVPREIYPGLLEHDLEVEPLYQVLSQVIDGNLCQAEETIECIMADERRAGLLRILPGSPVILVQRLCLLDSSRPVEYRRTFYRTDRYRLRRILGPHGERDASSTNLIEDGK